MPLSIGGDHAITYPILRAVARRHGAVGVVHVDAHADVNQSMFSERFTHGSRLRLAIDEGLVDPTRTVQIGLRGTGCAAEDFGWITGLGARVIAAEAYWHHSLAPIMHEVREQVGEEPMYITFDVDGLDPSVAPGTGSPRSPG